MHFNEFWQPSEFFLLSKIYLVALQQNKFKLLLVCGAELLYSGVLLCCCLLPSSGQEVKRLFMCKHRTQLRFHGNLESSKPINISVLLVWEHRKQYV